MPRQYSPQFLARALALLDEGRTDPELCGQLGIASATLYRWRQQARIDAGELPGPTRAEAAELADARRRTRHLEEELQATKLAASMLKDEGIHPKGDSRTCWP